MQASELSLRERWLHGAPIEMRQLFDRAGLKTVDGDAAVTIKDEVRQSVVPLSININQLFIAYIKYLCEEEFPRERLLR